MGFRFLLGICALFSITSFDTQNAGYYTVNNSKEDYNFTKGDDVWDISSKKGSWKNRKKGQPVFYMHNIGNTRESSVHFSEKDIDLKTLRNNDVTYGYADRFDEKYDLVRSVRKGKYKYIRSFQPFLLLMSDNQSWNHLGCYGNKILETPNIDNLAKEGVMFTNAFVREAGKGTAKAIRTDDYLYIRNYTPNRWPAGGPSAVWRCRCAYIALSLAHKLQERRDIVEGKTT